jgi:SAM-dependent methyltransferase
MGFERNAASLFLKLSRDGIPLGRVLTLGRQDVHLDASSARELRQRLGWSDAWPLPAHADEIIRAIGASSVEAMDYSAYQGATLLHDLNQPIPADWHQRFDIVFDGGTLEHVFNLPAAFASCMQLLKPGGRFLAVTVANNWCGHGFYQFSPELFFRVFTPDNGCSIVEMYVGDAEGRRHYAVVDPAVARSRVELWTSDPVYLLVHARRDAIVEPFTSAPNQADYERDWSEGTQQQAPPRPRAAWKSLPGVEALLALRARQYWRRQRRRSLEDRRFFTPVTLPF